LLYDLLHLLDIDQQKDITMNFFAKAGAISYILWGLLHIEAARRLYMLGQSLDPGMLQGRIFQGAWNLLFFALFGIVVAVVWNWRNSRSGYWMNLVVVSAGDIGFILFLLMPGYIPLMPGGLGPLLWLLALAFSTLGIMKAKP
jgi:hypothetical protein